VESELLQEIKQLNIEIPLLQAIKDVPELNQFIKQYCIKMQGRKKNFPPTIQVEGKVVDLLEGEIPLPKYGDPGNPVITVFISGVEI